MEKFSIIIPTLWKASEIFETLKRASECKGVGEILIIDNRPNNTKKKEIRYKSKVKVISKGKNIYVNKSWNWGVEVAKYENICICNDDIVFNVKDTLKFLQKKGLKKLGIVGCNRMKHNRDSDIKIESVDEFNKSGFGVLMFIHKDNYVPIPEDIKIWWGDYWLFKKSKNRHVVKNIGLEGRYKTSVEDFRLITELDTFYKFTKIDPKIKSERDSIKNRKSKGYYTEKVKGIIKYIFKYPLKRIEGYLIKALSELLNYIKKAG